MISVSRTGAVVASAVLLSICTGAGHAERFTAEAIRGQCAAPEGSEEFAFCRGYVVALTDAVIARHDPDCIPPMVNDYQLALLMRKYLNANSESLHGAAVDGVLRGLAEIFRCERKGLK